MNESCAQSLTEGNKQMIVLLDLSKECQHKAEDLAGLTELE